MKKIIGLGNALVDILAILPDDDLLERINLPKGSMQLIDETKYKNVRQILSRMKTELSTGGSAGNTIKALAHLGARPGFIGKVGRDEMADIYRRDGEKDGTDLHLLESDAPTGVASAFVSPDGERTFATHLGASFTMGPDDIDQKMFDGYTHLYIEGYLVQNHDLILGAVKKAKEAGLKICLDLASYNIVMEDIDIFHDIVDNYVDIIFANEEEARAYTGMQPCEALERLASVCDIAVVKLGKEGSVAKQAGKTTRIHTDPAHIRRDTTGAGDFYAAGFMYGILRDLPLDKCGDIGSLLAGEVIKIIGTTLPEEKWEEIKKKVAEIENKK